MVCDPKALDVLKLVNHVKEAKGKLTKRMDSVKDTTDSIEKLENVTSVEKN